MIAGFSDLCFIVSSEIPKAECELYIERSVPTLANNFGELILEPKFTCSNELHECERQWYTRDLVSTYADRVLSSKPDFLKDDDYLNKLYDQMRANNYDGNTLSIVQFTDLHLDLEYKAGTSTVCNSEICCRGDELPIGSENIAGPYGAVA